MAAACGEPQQQQPEQQQPREQVEHSTTEQQAAEEDEQGTLIVGGDAEPRRPSRCRILWATMATVGVAGVGLALASAAAVFSSSGGGDHQAAAIAEEDEKPLSLYGEYGYGQMGMGQNGMRNYLDNYEDVTKVPCGSRAVCDCLWVTEDPQNQCGKVDFPRTKCWSCCCYRIYPDLYHQAMMTMHAWLQMERGSPGGYYASEEDYDHHSHLEEDYDGEEDYDSGSTRSRRQYRRHR